MVVDLEGENAILSIVQWHNIPSSVMRVIGRFALHSHFSYHGQRFETFSGANFIHR